MKKITIVDYGIGNLLSVKRAFEYCGAEVIFADTSEKIDQAARLVLPGVGAFADGMAGLKKQGLYEAVKKFNEKERPFLGICLGMQMMLERSEEFGSYEGLGFVAGDVVKMPMSGIDGKVHKIPNIGWYGLYSEDETGWDKTIFQNIQQGHEVYFVHSYMAIPENEKHVLAYYEYNGQKVCAAIHRGNLYGCQFHPEKSGKIGLEIVKQFLRI